MLTITTRGRWVVCKSSMYWRLRLTGCRPQRSGFLLIGLVSVDTRNAPKIDINEIKQILQPKPPWRRDAETMKRWLLTLTLLGFNFAGFAQTAFTQATLDEILADYKKDSKAFFTNRLSTDFRYTNPQGTYQNRNDIIAGDTQKIMKTEIAEPVIFQSGDLAVVSGIHKTESVAKDGTQSARKVACTYTFQRRANKWMFVASQQTSIAK